MSVESVEYISDLEQDRPRGSDRISQGDDHIRNIKKSIKQTFPNIDGEVSATDEEINYLVGLTGPIKDELDSGANDLAQLEANVAQNTSDIATNAAGIATNAAGIATNAAGIATNAVGIATNAAGIASNDAELAGHEGRISNNAQGIVFLDQNKADKTYVDQQNAAQDSVIAAKADKTYVDSQNNSQDSAIAAKADKSYVDSENDDQDSVISTKADKSDTYTKAQIDALVADASKGGGMVKLVQQPAQAGDFTCTVNPQAYCYEVPVSYDLYDRTAKLIVPGGMVFGFEYLFAFSGDSLSDKLVLDIEAIYFDGVQVYNNLGSMDDFEYTKDGGPVWPGSEKSTIVRAEESIEIKRMSAYGDGSKIYLAGFFSEA